MWNTALFFSDWTINKSSGVRSIAICVSVCYSVYLYVSMYVCQLACPKTTCSNFTKFSVHVTCRRVSVLLWRQCCTLCTFGFVDDAIFSHNGANGQNQRQRCVSFTRWRYWERSCCLQLPCFHCTADVVHQRHLILCLFLIHLAPVTAIDACARVVTTQLRATTLRWWHSRSCCRTCCRHSSGNNCSSSKRRERTVCSDRWSSSNFSSSFSSSSSSSRATSCRQTATFLCLTTSQVIILRPWGWKNSHPEIELDMTAPCIYQTAACVRSCDLCSVSCPIWARGNPPPHIPSLSLSPTFLISLHYSDKWNIRYHWLQLLILSPLTSTVQH